MTDHLRRTDPNRKPERPCAACFDMPWRRDAEGCVVCFKPYEAEQVISEPKRSASGIAGFGCW